MAAMTVSSMLCVIGALYGLYVLIRHLKAIRQDVATQMKYAFPIICGTLAWTSAAYTFYSMGITSHIDAPRVLMLISWCMLAGQYRQKYLSCGKRKRTKPQTTPR